MNLVGFSLGGLFGSGGGPDLDQFKAASFRGVPFIARETTVGGGRSVVVHEYPQRDEPYTEDNGRLTRRWTLQAFLVGDDLQRRRRALIAACEADGIGVLKHPTDGALKVRCETFESTQGIEKNYVEFALTFVEAGAVFNALPAKKASTPGFADKLRAAVRAFYKARTFIVGVNRKVNTLLTGSIEDRLAAMFELAGQLTGTDTSAFVYAVRVGADTADTLAGDSAAFLSTWEGATTSLAAPSDARLVAAAAFAGIATTQAALSGATTPAEEMAASNAAVLDLTLYAIAVAQAADLTAGQTWTTYDEALAAAEALDADMSTAALYLDDGDTTAALTDLRAAMFAAVMEAWKLPRLRTLEVRGVRTALDLAFDLYGDAGRAEELIALNNLADPNAVAGTLRVLTA